MEETIANSASSLKFWIDSILMGGVLIAQGIIIWTMKKKAEVIESAINTQSQLIKDQASVADSAMIYADKFDPSKFEEILKREFALEFADKISELTKAVEDAELSKQDYEKQLATQKRLIEAYQAEWVLPLVAAYASLAVNSRDIQVQRSLKVLQEGPAKKMFTRHYEQTKEQIRSISDKLYPEAEQKPQPED
ncbi:hypothetical protein FLL45_01490 [Aliikangiella marina]|uniref:Uncharacterized protein n=1 Tax=Aliikangiella marina TaxID=1712262 RepID=A0A545THF8_9GAMM|nr:hypothetical protein [Aliikangiella marina]TQV76660.1 hypothetical protein FLL45_01490 [Aliikangiella marina]